MDHVKSPATCAGDTASGINLSGFKSEQFILCRSACSEMVVALLVIIVLVDVVIVFVVVLNAFFLIRVILTLQVAHVFVARLPFLAKAILRLTHLIVRAEHGVLVFALIIEDFLLLGSLLLVLELVNDLLLLLSALRILEIVLVELMLKIVDVRELLDVDAVVLLQLLLEALVLFLVLRLHVLNTLEALLSSLELGLSTRELVEQLRLVQLKLLHGILHFGHLLSLVLDNVADALLNVHLLRVRIEIARDRVKEFESLVAAALQFSLLAEQVEQLGARFRDLTGQLARRLERVHLRAHVKVHHLGLVGSHVVIVEDALAGLHSLVHHGRNLEHFLDSKTASLIQLLCIQRDACFACEHLADLADEGDTILLLLNGVTYVHLWIVSLREPVQDVGDELEVGVPKVLDRDIAVEAERPHHLAKVS